MQFVTSDQQWEPQQLQHPLQTTPDVTMSMYDTPNSPSPAPISPNMFDAAINIPLPPSPVSCLMINSMSDQQIRYGDVNTLGLGFTPS